MSFTIGVRSAEVLGRTEMVLTLGDVEETVRAEVWPSFGFNMLRWQVRGDGADWADVLYCDPAWATNPVPTRSGHPILFPFPNRLQAGRFTHEGRDYQLPLNESTGKHAIHGFTPKLPWRHVGGGTTADHAWVRGEFRLSQDAPASLPNWPTDFILSITYRLYVDRMRVEVVLQNPSLDVALPYGLGFHPYFACPNAPDADADDMVLTTTARKIWEAEEAMPTGNVVPVPPELDFTSARRVGPLVVDRLLTDLDVPDNGTGRVVAELCHITAPGRIRVLVPSVFRELLIFTPPHRKAVAIEPYTCATDAANLQARGIDAGWLSLLPGAQFETYVEYQWDPSYKPVVGHEFGSP